LRSFQSTFQKIIEGTFLPGKPQFCGAVMGQHSKALIFLCKSLAMDDELEVMSDEKEVMIDE